MELHPNYCFLNHKLKFALVESQSINTSNTVSLKPKGLICGGFKLSSKTSELVCLLLTVHLSPLCPWHTIALVQSREAQSEVVQFGVTIVKKKALFVTVTVTRWCS